MRAKIRIHPSSKDVERGWTWWWSCFLELEDNGFPMSVYVHFILVINCLCASSSYLLVFDNDCVTRYMGTYDVSSGVGDA